MHSRCVYALVSSECFECGSQVQAYMSAAPTTHALGILSHAHATPTMHASVNTETCRAHTRPDGLRCLKHLCRAVVHHSCLEQWHLKQVRSQQVTFASLCNCLYACSGEELPHGLPALLQDRLAHETHHKVLRRMLQLLTLTSVNKPTAEAASAQRLSQSMVPSVHAMGEDSTAEDPVGTTAEAEQAGHQASACHQSTADDQASSRAASQDATADVGELQCDGSPQAVPRASSPYQADQSLALHSLARYQQIHTPVISSFQPGVRQAGLHALGAAVHPVLSALVSRARLSSPQHQDYCQHQQHTSQQRHHSSQPKQQSSESSLDGQLSDAVTGFMQLVQDSSEAQQSDAIRLSAVKALEASGRTAPSSTPR